MKFDEGSHLAILNIDNHGTEFPVIYNLWRSLSLCGVRWCFLTASINIFSKNFCFDLERDFIIPDPAHFDRAALKHMFLIMSPRVLVSQNFGKMVKIGWN